MRNLEERFWEKVKKTEGCWFWLAYKVPTGHGRFRVGGKDGEMTPAHRVSYRLLKGEIPKGMDLDHLCKNPSCVNPEHLEPVTRAENVMRGTGYGPTNAAKTSCLRGHIFDGENTYFDKHGKRSCKECRRMALESYRKRRKCH